MKNSEILTRFWDNTIQRFINVPPTMDFVSPLRSVNYDPLRARTNIDYSYRIGVRGQYSDEMMSMHNQDLGLRIVEETEQRLRDAMAERMITDGIMLINPDMPEIIISPRMPEVILAHPRIYHQLLGSIGYGGINERWFPP